MEWDVVMNGVVVMEWIADRPGGAQS